MADIAAERAWMRRHAAQQATEDATRSQERWHREREDLARTCRFCFHAAHIIDYGGSLIDLAVLHCRTDGCICGVTPCATCGSRERAPYTDRLVERCANCGAEWPMAVYA